MEHLVKELNVLLKLLEHEHVSSATTEKMSVIRNLLGQLKPSGKEADLTDLHCLLKRRLGLGLDVYMPVVIWNNHILFL